jgi:hypothetical protein
MSLPFFFSIYTQNLMISKLNKKKYLIIIYINYFINLIILKIFNYYIRILNIYRILIFFGKGQIRLEINN